MRTPLRSRLFTVATFAAASLAIPALGSAQAGAPPAAPADTMDDPVRILVARLDLEKYKATIKGLTQFGDRRQGTDRNRAAVDWIEAQLQSYGCPTERIRYEYRPPAPPAAGTPRPVMPPRNPNLASGGGRLRGVRARTGVNTDSSRQPDPKLRALNAQPTTPGMREQVYCTKVGSTRPDEMYIIGGHMDGHGWGEAANDDGSGSAIVMELARILSSPGVRTDRTIRFVLWNNEETGASMARERTSPNDRRCRERRSPPVRGNIPSRNGWG